MSLLQLTKSAGDLGEIACLEHAESKAHTAIAPAPHEQKAAEKEGQAAPVGGDQAIFQALMGFPTGAGEGLMAMAEESLSFPSGIIVVLAHVAVDATQVAVVDEGADQTNGVTHERVFVNLHIAY